MKNDEVVIAVALVLILIVLVIIEIIRFFVRFNKETQYITIEMQHSFDYKTYRYWRGELRCHYLCLIPFVNQRNVMGLYRLIYHRSKPNNIEKRSDGLYHILAPSLISICICVICICGGSWAWFTTTHTSNVSTIQTATYIVSVMAKEGDKDIIVTDNGYVSSMLVEAGSEYTIILAVDGSAKSGYCKIEYEEKEYFTPQIIPGNIFTFKFKTNSDGILKITSQWGTCSVTESIIESDTILEVNKKSNSKNVEYNNNNNNVSNIQQETSAIAETTKPVKESSKTKVDIKDEETSVLPETSSREGRDEDNITDEEQYTTHDKTNQIYIENK